MIREYIIKISDEVFEDECAGNPPELVRCKDCKHWNHIIDDRGHCGNFMQCYDGDLYTDDDWFCADGERKQ